MNMNDNTDTKIPTVGSVYSTLTFEQRSVVEFLVGCVIMSITDKEEYENLKQNTFNVEWLRDVRILKGFGFLESEGFYEY